MHASAVASPALSAPSWKANPCLPGERQPTLAIVSPGRGSNWLANPISSSLRRAAASIQHEARNPRPGTFSHLDSLGEHMPASFWRDRRLLGKGEKKSNIAISFSHFSFLFLFLLRETCQLETPPRRPFHNVPRRQCNPSISLLQSLAPRTRGDPPGLVQPRANLLAPHQFSGERSGPVLKESVSAELWR